MTALIPDNHTHDSVSKRECLDKVLYQLFLRDQLKTAYKFRDLAKRNTNASQRKVALAAAVQAGSVIHPILRRECNKWKAAFEEWHDTAQMSDAQRRDDFSSLEGTPQDFVTKALVGCLNSPKIEEMAKHSRSVTTMLNNPDGPRVFTAYLTLVWTFHRIEFLVHQIQELLRGCRNCCSRANDSLVGPYKLYCVCLPARSHDPDVRRPPCNIVDAVCDTTDGLKLIAGKCSLERFLEYRDSMANNNRPQDASDSNREIGNSTRPALAALRFDHQPSSPIIAGH